MSNDGAFNYGGTGKSGVSPGKESKLPRHIERMNEGTSGPEMKKSVGTSDSGLPWGGRPAEQSKAYATGVPKNKGSMTNKTGERTKSVGSLPQDGGKAHVGFKGQIKSKSQHMGKKSK